jgi:hypothetical protein
VADGEQHERRVGVDEPREELRETDPPREDGEERRVVEGEEVGSGGGQVDCGEEEGGGG